MISQEYEDVQLTAYLSALTKSASILNDVRNILPTIRISQLRNNGYFFSSLTNIHLSTLMDETTGDRQVRKEEAHKQDHSGQPQIGKECTKLTPFSLLERRST
jgi:hypothetical protein